MHSIIDDPAGWDADFITRTDAWIHRFTPAQIDEIEKALAHARSKGLDFETLTKDDFPLPTLTSVFQAGLEQLEHGLGLQLFRGFPAERYAKSDLRLIYWAFGLHLGTPMSQSMRGDVLGDVRNLNLEVNSPKGRGYTSNQQLSFHTDSCDVVGLFVMRAAKSGGLSMIASSVAVHNEIARLRPDLLEVLYQPFYWSWQGQEPEGGKPWYTQPIFTMHEGRFSCRIVKVHLAMAQRFPDVPRFTPLQNEALEMMREVSADPRFAFSMMFEPGDLQLLNNHVMLHSRTAFEDHEEPERKRHLLRMWLAVPNSRALSPQRAPIYADQRAGAVRGGFPSRIGRHVYETVDSQPALD